MRSSSTSLLSFASGIGSASHGLVSAMAEHYATRPRGRPLRRGRGRLFLLSCVAQPAHIDERFTWPKPSSTARLCSGTCARTLGNFRQILETGRGYIVVVFDGSDVEV